MQFYIQHTKVLRNYFIIEADTPEEATKKFDEGVADRKIDLSHPEIISEETTAAALPLTACAWK